MLIFIAHCTINIFRHIAKKKKEKKEGNNGCEFIYRGGSRHFHKGKGRDVFFFVFFLKKKNGISKQSVFRKSKRYRGVIQSENNNKNGKKKNDKDEI